MSKKTFNLLILLAILIVYIIVLGCEEYQDIPPEFRGKSIDEIKQILSERAKVENYSSTSTTTTTINITTTTAEETTTTQESSTTTTEETTTTTVPINETNQTTTTTIPVNETTTTTLVNETTTTEEITTSTTTTSSTTITEETTTSTTTTSTTTTTVCSSDYEVVLTDSLEEGEYKEYVVGNHRYLIELTVCVWDSFFCKFRVNGTITDKIYVGQTEHNLDDCYKLGIESLGLIDHGDEGMAEVAGILIYKGTNES